MTLLRAASAALKGHACGALWMRRHLSLTAPDIRIHAAPKDRASAFTGVFFLLPPADAARNWRRRSACGDPVRDVDRPASPAIAPERLGSLVGKKDKKLYFTNVKESEIVLPVEMVGLVHLPLDHR